MSGALQWAAEPNIARGLSPVELVVTFGDIPPSKSLEINDFTMRPMDPTLQ